MESLECKVFIVDYFHHLYFILKIDKLTKMVSIP